MRLLTSLLLVAAAAATFAQTATIKVRVVQAPLAIDTMKIKAIGSVQTKTSPTILQVTQAEAARLEKLIIGQGGKVLGAPSVRTVLGKQAGIKMDGDEGIEFTVLPTSKSDTISMQYKLAVTQRTGRTRITHSSTGSARLLQTRRLLIIQNPRDGVQGFMAIVEATRD